MWLQLVYSFEYYHYNWRAHFRICSSHAVMRLWSAVYLTQICRCALTVPIVYIEPSSTSFLLTVDEFYQPLFMTRRFVFLDLVICYSCHLCTLYFVWIFQLDKSIYGQESESSLRRSVFVDWQCYVNWMNQIHIRNRPDADGLHCDYFLCVEHSFSMVLTRNGDRSRRAT